jgi:basic membrane protein A
MRRLGRAGRLALTLGLLAPSCISGAADNGERVSACEVLLGRIGDGGINETAHGGLKRAARKLGVKPQMQTGYEANIEIPARRDCDAIVAVGYRLAEPALQTAKKHPELKFAIVDYWFDFSSAQELERKNVALLAYRTDEAAFLAGYLAGGMSKSGIVGTFGGYDDFATRTVMNGFKAGVDAYGQDKLANVKLLGWDGRRGYFSGSPSDRAAGRKLAERLISDDADVLLPVASAAALGAADAARRARDVLVIGMDTDRYKTAPSYREVWLTSILRSLGEDVFEVLKEVSRDTFKGGIRVGTLANGGVSLAPFHAFESDIPPFLDRKLVELERGITEGWVSVDPADYAPHGHEHHD